MDKIENSPSTLFDLLGSCRRHFCVILNGDLEWVYGNKAIRDWMAKLDLFPKASDSLQKYLVGFGEETAQIWTEAIERVNPTHPECLFSYKDDIEGRQLRIDAEVTLQMRGKVAEYYLLAFDEVTDNFLEKKFKRLVSEFNEKALQIQNISELLWVLVDEVLGHLYLEDAIILVRNGDVLVPSAAHGSQRLGQRAVSTEVKVSVSEGITGFVATTGKSYLSADISKDPHYISRHFEAGSEVAVPIMLRGKVFGVINCESRKGNFFRTIHEELLFQAAETLSIKIEQIVSHEEVKILEQSHSAILNSTSNSFLLFDEHLDLISFNYAAEKAWSTYLNLVLASPQAFTTVVPVGFQSDLRLWAKSALAGKSLAVQRPFVNGNLQKQLKITSAPARNREGFIFGFTVLIEDVTALHKANTDIRSKNQKLSESNKELDKFVYSISHDLRAPLSSIMGLVNLIDTAEHMPEVKIYGKMLQDAADSMDSYIRNILEFSRNKRLDIVLKEIELKTVLKDVNSKFKFIPGYREMDFTTEMEVSLIRSDAFRLEIILNNLMSNAIKYRDLGKRISWCKLRIVSADDFWRLEVSDNGIGIPEDQIANLFKMFFKVKSEHPGSGLGLYILKQVVDSLGGRIAVTSILKKGSTFTVYLPK